MVIIEQQIKFLVMAQSSQIAFITIDVTGKICGINGRFIGKLDKEELELLKKTAIELQWNIIENDKNKQKTKD